ncbi:calcium-binding protein [Ruegeria sp. PrR005]|uniref:Calcium-binding protein n=2 Tax=Ruegeria sp. PrR005 TaxID=2706882 RepID=A0A6B2NSF9_9RHOB|nr:calcium-binding protein [Ruegeria sp. PrR005]
MEARARVYNADGTARSAEITLATSSVDDQRDPRLAPTADGGFLAMWRDQRATGASDDAVFGQRFTSDGSRNGEEFFATGNDVIRNDMIVLAFGDIRFLANTALWKSDGSLVGTGPLKALNASSSSSQDTGFSTAFTSTIEPMSDGNYAMAGVVEDRALGGYGVAVRVRDASDFDNPVLSESGESRLLASDAPFPIAAQNFVGVDIAALDGGGLVVTWAFLIPDAVGGGEFNVLAQAFDANLNKLGDNVIVHQDTADDQGAPFVVQGDDGRILIGWTDDRSATDFRMPIVGRFFSLDGGTGGSEPIEGTSDADVLTGTAGDDTILGLDGNDRLLGEAGNDSLDGGLGADTLNGGDGDDVIIGGPSEGDLRDVIFAGEGNDSVDAGAGNDQVFGQGGNDTIAGGFGVDELQGQDGDDVITGSAFSDLVFGGAGDDFVNGGFGHDRINGGTGADKFFHVGASGHGSDWVQDYSSAEGDVLLFGNASATRDQFQVNFNHTQNAEGERAGDDAVQEAFVIYRPTGQIMWALVDGAGQSSINLQIGSDVFDLLA